MKKSNAIILFFFLVALLQAQTAPDWLPVRPNVQYNYRIDTSNNAVSDVIRADSVIAQNYYLNTIVTSCDTCKNALLANDPFDSTYVLNHQPQFLNSAIMRAGNAFYFKGRHAFVIYPYAAVGTSWLYDTTQNISATVFSKGSQQVFGAADSVSVIHLSTNDTIVLSKNSGILKFPKQVGNTHRSYRLVGLEGAQNAGVALKHFHDFFNFQAGDVLQYEFINNDYNLFPPMFMAGRERWDVLSVSVFNDSVSCMVRKTHLDSLKYGGSAATLTAYTSTANLTFIDSSQHLANAWPHQQILANPYFLFNNGIRHIHKVEAGTNGNRSTKTFGQVCPELYLSNGTTGAACETPFTDVFLNRNSSKIVGRQLTEGLGVTSELYNDYDRMYQNCLVGYVKNGDTTGTIYNDVATGIKSNTIINKFSIGPIPANDEVVIHGDLNAITNLILVNTLGETIAALPSSARTINTASLPGGLYFIVISEQHFSETKKLLIQH